MTPQREGGASEPESGGAGKGFYLLLGGLVVLGVAALVWAGTGSELEPVGPLTTAERQVPADSSAMAATMGPEDAPVTLVEFADYTCSHCARFASLPAKAIRRDYVRTGQVRWILYDFPLRAQGNAIPAALAARCAGAQGSYWEMHDRLFARQRDWAADGSPEDRFRAYADEIGLDLEAFAACYSDRRFVEAIMASRQYGRLLGVNSTPTIFVDGQRAGDYRYQTLQPLIEGGLGGQQAAASDGGGEG